MIDWADILKKLGSTALILGAAAYVAKKLIETWLAHRLDTHKSDLNQASETALENLRYDLRVAEAQQRTCTTQPEDRQTRTAPSPLVRGRA